MFCSWCEKYLNNFWGWQTIGYKPSLLYLLRWIFPSYREDGELEDGEIDDEGIGIEEENKEATEVTEEKEKEREKEKEKEKAKEKEEKAHRHSRKRYKKTREKRRSKRRRRDRQKVRCHFTCYNIVSLSATAIRAWIWTTQTNWTCFALSSAPLPLQQLQLWQLWFWLRPTRKTQKQEEPGI